jgi:nicotinamide-nucleotide amidase
MPKHLRIKLASHIHEVLQPKQLLEFPIGVKYNVGSLWRIILRAEIISVGTELLLGQIVDTNAPYLSRALSSLGIDVYYRSTVGDNHARLAEAIRTALSRSDIVLTIGGLGPTQDDLTKETISDVLGERMIMHPESEKAIRAFFERRGSPIAESNLKQALQPESGIALPNPMGTAPGTLVEKNGKIVAAFPGPPSEFVPMIDNALIPYLAKKTAGKTAVIVSKTLRVVGIGESSAEEVIRELLSGSNPTIAPYAKTGEVHFRITAKSPDEETAFGLIADMEKKARALLGEYIYGVDDETLESVVVNLLVRKNLRLALAESCTGGAIANRITNVPGSSKAFLAGVVSYSNESKTEILGVPAEMIHKHGAVSPEVAEAMARGAAERTGAEIAVSVTGIAGPDGGSAEKPVGLVYIGLRTPDGVSSTRNFYVGGRQGVKDRSVQTALDTIRTYLLHK